MLNLMMIIMNDNQIMITIIKMIFKLISILILPITLTEWESYFYCHCAMPIEFDYW